MSADLEKDLLKMVKPERKWFIDWNPTPSDPYAVLIHHFSPSSELARHLAKIPGVLAVRPVRLYNSIIDKDIPANLFGFYLTVHKHLYSEQSIRKGIEYVLQQWEENQEKVNKMIGWDDHTDSVDYFIDGTNEKETRKENSF